MIIKTSFVVMLVAVTLTVVVMAGAFFPARADDKPKGPVIAPPREFVETNLTAFKEELRKFKEQYAGCCGSILAAMSPTDVETIAKDLPKPRTLKLTVEYPPVSAPDKKARLNANGQFFLHDLYASAMIDPVFNFNGAYSTASNNTSQGLVAADPLTSELLGIPHKVYYSLSGRIVWVDPSRKTGSYQYMNCCIRIKRDPYCAQYSAKGDGRCIRTGYNEYCDQWAELPSIGYGWDNPTNYKSRLNLNISNNGAGTDEGMQSITFSRPGKVETKFSSNRKYLPEDPYISYRSCIEKYSGYGGWSYGYGNKGRDKAIIGYKPAGSEEASLRFTSARFMDFGLPGFGKLEKYGTKPKLDHFVDLKSARISTYNSWYYNNLAPMVLIDYGDAGGEKAQSCYNLRSSVSWKTKAYGPFEINNGNVRYHGGYGATDFYITLGGTRTVEYRLTANIVEVEPDEGIKAGKIAPGKTHTVAFRVKGPAGLDNYLVKWKAPGLIVEKEDTEFEGAGDKAATGRFSLPFQGPGKPRDTKTFKIMCTLVEKANPDTVYYSWESGNLVTSNPAIAGLELYASQDAKKPPERIEGALDIFFPSETSSVPLVPFVTLADGKAYNLREANPDAIIELTSTNPSAVSVYQTFTGDKNNKKFQLVALCSGQTGTSQITARIGGVDLSTGQKVQFTGDRDELKSIPVTVNANKIFLLGYNDTGGKKIFKLIIQGPTDMSAYQALWVGEAKRSTSFNKDSEGYSTSLSTTLRMDSVRIVRGSVEIARIAVKPGTVRRAKIRLIPPNPPVTAVKKTDVTDLGSLETLTECRKTVRFGMEYLGFDPGTTVEEYCKAERERKKEEIKTQREEQKEFNKMVSDMKKAGKELIIFGNDMRVGAAVGGDLATTDGNLFCFWSLIGGGNLVLEKSITPVETISPEEGGCFNFVSGMKQGFNPDAKIQVDLVVIGDIATPVVATGGKAISQAELLKD